jgi:hypothetical protein
VLIFGGSTVFGQEVPDRWTIPSCLQRRLNEHSAESWRVENYGTVSMNARQHAQRLADTSLNPGDVVVFYCGVNDVFYSIYNGNPSGWLPGDGHDGGVRRPNPLQRLLYPLLLKWRDTSALAELLFRRCDRPWPANLSDARAFEKHLAAARSGYLAALVQAGEHVAQRGGCFVHCLQPHLFRAPRQSDYERRRIALDLSEYPGLDAAFEKGYAELRSAARAAEAQGVLSFDLADMLDDRPEGVEVYLDFCHVNEEANDRIARRMYETIFDHDGCVLAGGDPRRKLLR